MTDTTTPNTLLQNSKLGKATEYIAKYAPELLFPISRLPNRTEINVPTPLPFYGFDVWNAYELSWLNEKGKPIVAIGEFIFPYDSPNIIESKSIKLYLNSLNNTQFPNKAVLIDTIKKDFSRAGGAAVKVNIQIPSEIKNITTASFNGDCIDSLDITTNEYQVNPNLLTTEKGIVEETLHSHLLKSNCPCTGQPDWASVKIHYKGNTINRENLLKYIISYRNHSEFHEQCVERMFMDIIRQCTPESLTIEARYTRRGGIDINPTRSTSPKIKPTNARQLRQ